MNVLFVCTENTCRSPMAEYFFNYYNKDIEKENIAKSVGITAHGDYASKNSLLTMSKSNIDMTRHISKQITKEDVDWADLILTMGQTHLDLITRYIPNDKTFTFYDYVENKKQDILDPYGMNLEIYGETKEEIEKLVKKLLNIL